MKEVEIYRDCGSIEPALLAAFEQAYSIKLPASYKTLIVQHDELRPTRDTFDFINPHIDNYEYWPNRPKDDIETREISFYGFQTNLNGVNIQSAQDFDVYGHAHVVAFGRSANGDYICFDYRCNPQTDAPRIVFMYHDTYDSNRKMLLCDVAGSFEEFMDSLYEFHFDE